MFFTKFKRTEKNKNKKVYIIISLLTSEPFINQYGSPVFFVGRDRAKKGLELVKKSNKGKRQKSFIPDEKGRLISPDEWTLLEITGNEKNFIPVK